MTSFRVVERDGFVLMFDESAGEGAADATIPMGYINGRLPVKVSPKIQAMAREGTDEITH